MNSAILEQGYHHNGDRAARQPHVFCSISVHQFGDLEKAVRLFRSTLHIQPTCFNMHSTDTNAYLTFLQRELYIALAVIGWCARVCMWV